MAAFSPSTWNMTSEFNCPGCGHDEAYFSRSRGLFEKFLLPLFLLRPVRCARCYHRSYALRSVQALRRVTSAGRHNQAQPAGVTAGPSRIA